MDTATLTQKLSAPAQKILDPKSPPPLRQMAARGIAPGLKPHEAITVVYLLSQGESDAAAQAKTTWGALPAPLLNGALSPDLAPEILEVLAVLHATKHEVMEKILALPQISMQAVERVAAEGSELVCELVATNEQRMLAHPIIIEKLYLNKATRMSTADRVLELAVRNGVELSLPAFKEAAAAIQGELIAEPQEEPTPDDVLFREHDAAVEAKDVPLEATHVIDEQTGEERAADTLEEEVIRIDKMTPSQKVRRAQLTTKPFERAILLRDHNRNVAMAAIKNPLLTEDEVVRVTQSRSANDDVLAFVARNREWMRSYQIKLNLCTNPRTPLMYVTQLITHLREADLKKIASSKNVPGPVQTAAKNQLSRKSR